MVIKVKNPIPKRVKCTLAGSDIYQKGITYYVAKDQKVIDKEGDSITYWDSNSYGDSRFEPIYTEEELLEYAAKMYPIGTKYRGIDSEGIPEDITSEAEDEYPQHNSCGIYVGYRYVYIHGTKQWADIITEKKETVVEEFIETPKFTAEHPDILEAKKKYPVGTKFHPAHITTTSYCTVEENDIFQINSDGNILLSHGNQEKNGHVFSEVIRDHGIWAKIVKPEVNEKYLKVKEEYLTELGHNWYSLVGYKLQTLKGNIVTIIQHNESGYVVCDDGNDYDVHEMVKPYCMKYKLVKVLANSNPEKQNPWTLPDCFLPGTDSESFTLQMDKDLTMAWKEEFNRAFSTPISAPNHGITGGKIFADQAAQVGTIYRPPKYPIGFKFIDTRNNTRIITDYNSQYVLYEAGTMHSFTEEYINQCVEEMKHRPIKLIRKNERLLKRSKIVACTTIPVKLSKTLNK